MIMTRFGALRSQFTKYSVHKGKSHLCREAIFCDPKEGRIFMLSGKVKGISCPAPERRRGKRDKNADCGCFLTFYFAIVAFCHTLTFPLQANKE